MTQTHQTLPYTGIVVPICEHCINTAVLSVQIEKVSFGYTLF